MRSCHCFDSFDDVMNALRIIALTARIAFLRYEAQVQRREPGPSKLANVKVMARAKLLEHPDPEEAGDVQGSTWHHMIQDHNDFVPSWPRHVIVCLLCWCRAFVSLVIAEYCVMRVTINLREDSIEELTKVRAVVALRRPIAASSAARVVAPAGFDCHGLRHQPG